MEEIATAEFRWGSSLGVSVALFLLVGVVHLAIGILAPILSGRDPSPAYLLTGPRADTALLGEPTGELFGRIPQIPKIWWVLVRWLAALLVGIGVLEIALAWFGLRSGERWALVALAASGIAMLPILYLSYAPFREAGVSVGLTELPPYQWIAAVAMVPATVLGWLAMR